MRSGRTWSFLACMPKDDGDLELDGLHPSNNPRRKVFQMRNHDGECRRQERLYSNPDSPVLFVLITDVPRKLSLMWLLI